jgi:hypothetical protein
MAYLRHAPRRRSTPAARVLLSIPFPSGYSNITESEANRASLLDYDCDRAGDLKGGGYIFTNGSIATTQLYRLFGGFGQFYTPQTPRDIVLREQSEQ